MSDEEREEKELDLSSPEVVTKWVHCVVAHTHVLQEGPVTGKAADVIAAANIAAEVALRLVRPGKKNKDVTYVLLATATKITKETRVDDVEFEENEVYCIDIVTSTGEGKALEDKRARLGLVECVNHELLQPYPVLHEKPGDLVAHINSTVLLMPNGLDRITSHALQEIQPTKTIDDLEIKSWLALGTKTKKKGCGKKKKESLKIL
ncbi:hypothetical protein Leryth_011628 [Lithospermum erythrorhizon]|nr:hypothetical protein Leryth_011628 [Lithospermum erythrorhizon]